jgi:hypothetical protein
VIDDDSSHIYEPTKDDPRVRMEIADDLYPQPVVLWFESWAEDAPLVGFGLGSAHTPSAKLRPEDAQRAAANVALYEKWGRAWLAMNRGEVGLAIQLLDEVGRTRRGKPARFLRVIAYEYNARVEGGERAPVTAVAKAHNVSKATASRWISAARKRNWITDDKGRR